jgi:hypothetical protein
MNRFRRNLLLIGCYALAVAASAASAANVGVRPGGERWRVRLGEDKDASKVAVYVLPRTVEDLRALPRQNGGPASRQRGVAEMRRFVTKGTLVGYSVGRDGSYRLRIAGQSGQTITAEIPRLEFIPGNNPWHREIAVARARFQDRFKLKEDAKTVSTNFVAATAHLRLVGVGHYEAGSGSPNGFMLAPVMSLVWLP